MTYLLIAAAYLALAYLVGRVLAGNDAPPPPRRPLPPPTVASLTAPASFTIVVPTNAVVGVDGAVSVPGRKRADTPDGVEMN